MHACRRLFLTVVSGCDGRPKSNTCSITDGLTACHVGLAQNVDTDRRWLRPSVCMLLPVCVCACLHMCLDTGLYDCLYTSLYTRRCTHVCTRVYACRCMSARMSTHMSMVQSAAATRGAYFGARGRRRSYHIYIVMALYSHGPI